MEYTHDHMILALVAMYPNLSHWKDYKVAHPISKDTGEQCGDPWITAWTAADPQPTNEAVRAYFEEHRAELCAQYVRYHRDDRLQWSDRFSVVPPDAPPAVQARAAAWIEYRKALRDITEQPGFPLDVTWPEVPSP